MLTDEGIMSIAEVYRNWETREKLSRVVPLEAVRASDYNLSPSQFVEINGKVQHRLISDILADLVIAKAESHKADIELTAILRKLGLEEVK